jgi:hypothetical protein
MAADFGSPGMPGGSGLAGPTPSGGLPMGDGTGGAGGNGLAPYGATGPGGNVSNGTDPGGLGQPGGGGMYDPLAAAAGTAAAGGQGNGSGAGSGGGPGTPGGDAGPQLIASGQGAPGGGAGAAGGPGSSNGTATGASGEPGASATGANSNSSNNGASSGANGSMAGSNGSAGTAAGGMAANSAAGGSPSPLSGGMPSFSYGQQPSQPNTTTDMNRPSQRQLESLARKRGRNWGLPEAEQKATGLTRPVQVYCSADRLTILSDRGVPDRQINLGAKTEDSVDELVNVVRSQIDSWGLAGRNMYWKPVLSLHVAPDGAERFQELKTLLAGSGFEVTGKPIAVSGAPTTTARRP